MFGSKRRRPAPPVLTNATASPFAATAAASAFARQKTAASSLSQAAAAAALKARPPTPTDVSAVVSKRALKRASSVSSSHGSGSPHGLRRADSASSMTQRTFRSPSPRDPPPMPSIPDDVEPPTKLQQEKLRARTTTKTSVGIRSTPIRVGSQKLQDGEGSWFVGPTVGDKTNVRTADVALSGTTETARPSSRTSANFSYPARVRLGSPPSSPITTQARHPQSLAQADSDAVPPHSLDGGQDEKLGSKPEPRREAAQVAVEREHDRRGTRSEPEPGPPTEVIAPDGRVFRVEDVYGDTQDACKRIVFYIGNEFAPGTDPVTGKPLQIKLTMPPEETPREDMPPKENYLPYRGLKRPDGKRDYHALRRSSRSDRYVADDRPGRARFDTSPPEALEELAVKHDPPHRSVSPGKSIMKGPGAARSGSPAIDTSTASEASPEPASVTQAMSPPPVDTVDTSASPPSAARAESPLRRWFRKRRGSRSSDSEDDVKMKPRPKLPFFGSIRYQRRQVPEESERPLRTIHGSNAVPTPPESPQLKLSQAVGAPQTPTSTGTGASSDHAIGVVIAQDLRSREPLPPVVTSKEPKAFHMSSSSESDTSSSDDEWLGPPPPPPPASGEEEEKDKTEGSSGGDPLRVPGSFPESEADITAPTTAPAAAPARPSSPVQSAIVADEGTDEPSDGGSVYVDAVEDINDMLDSTYLSLDAAVSKPLRPGRKFKWTGGSEEEEPQPSAEEQWESAKAYFKTLSAEKRAQLQKEVFMDDAGADADVDESKTRQTPPKRKKSAEPKPQPRRPKADDVVVGKAETAETEFAGMRKTMRASAKGSSSHPARLQDQDRTTGGRLFSLRSLSPSPPASPSALPRMRTSLRDNSGGRPSTASSAGMSSTGSRSKGGGGLHMPSFGRKHKTSGSGNGSGYRRDKASRFADSSSDEDLGGGNVRFKSRYEDDSDEEANAQQQNAQPMIPPPATRYSLRSKKKSHREVDQFGVGLADVVEHAVLDVHALTKTVPVSPPPPRSPGRLTRLHTPPSARSGLVSSPSSAAKRDDPHSRGLMSSILGRRRTTSSAIDSSNSSGRVVRRGGGEGMDSAARRDTPLERTPKELAALAAKQQKQQHKQKQTRVPSGYGGPAVPMPHKLHEQSGESSTSLESESEQRAHLLFDTNDSSVPAVDMPPATTASGAKGKGKERAEEAAAVPADPIDTAAATTTIPDAAIPDATTPDLPAAGGVDNFVPSPPRAMSELAGPSFASAGAASSSSPRFSFAHRRTLSLGAEAILSNSGANGSSASQVITGSTVETTPRKKKFSTLRRMFRLDT